MATLTFGTSKSSYDLVRLFIEDMLDRLDMKVASSSSTNFVIESNDLDTNRYAVATGSGFTYGADGLPVQGTITAWTSSDKSGLVGTAENINLSVAELMAVRKLESRDAKGAIFNAVMSGNDVLTGSSKNDFMEAFGGKDYLYGGRGGDSLFGGKGADRFVYKSVSDSRPETKKSYGANADYIHDFSHKEKDKIDLRAIDANTKKAGNQAFSFIGNSAFTKKAGELRYKIATDPNEGGKEFYIQGDVNGDGRADLEIQLAKAMKLVKSDFIL